MGFIRSSRTEEFLAGPSTLQRFEYTTAIVRSKMVGDRMDGSAVEKELDSHAREGWQLKSVTETEVKGRIGPGSTMGLLLIFERNIVR